MSVSNVLAPLAAFAFLSVMPAGAADTCSVGTPLTGGTPQCSSNASGPVGSFTWTIWSSGSGGCMTPYGVGAAFKANWNNAGDFLAREGFQWNETKTYAQYGTISASYAYTKTGSAGGYSFIGIYGWSNNPLVEFYIVDDWYGSGSPPTGGGTLKGSITADGGTYKIYTHTQVNQPSIHGTATFPQFFSVRQTQRQCGQISLTQHFRAWDSLGMTLGKMSEAKLVVEVGGGIGSIDFTAGNMVAGTTPVVRIPGLSSERGLFSAVGNSRGVLTLFSLTGTRIWSVRQNGFSPAQVPGDNLEKGLYILQFQGDKISVTRTLYLNE